MSEDPEPKVLLVDDDEVDIRTVRRGFQRAGITNSLVEAKDGIDALEILRGSDGRGALETPYIILLDLNMPRMGGLEFLRELRADPTLHHHIVFVLTTSDDDQDKSAAYDMFIAGYVTKASAGRDFLQLVNMLERFLVTVRFPPEKDSSR